MTLDTGELRGWERRLVAAAPEAVVGLADRGRADRERAAAVAEGRCDRERSY